MPENFFKKGIQTKKILYNSYEPLRGLGVEMDVLHRESAFCQLTSVSANYCFLM
jgi:hypothetical protein